MKNKLSLGSAQFGLKYGINNTEDKLDRSSINHLLDYAFCNGVTEIDTAISYGDSSFIINDYLNNSTNKFLINTKFTKKEIKKDGCNIDFKSLIFKEVNTLFYHSFDDFFNNPNLFKNLRELKTLKIIKKIGISIYTNKEFSMAINEDLFDVIQIPYNLFDNFTQRGDLIKEAKKRGIEIHARSVFLQGLFFINPELLPTKLLPLYKYCRTLHDYCLMNDLNVQELALNYVIKEPLIDKVIIGVDNINQLMNNLNCLNKHIPDSHLFNIGTINVKEYNLLYPINWS